MGRAVRTGLGREQPETGGIVREVRGALGENAET